MMISENQWLNLKRTKNTKWCKFQITFSTHKKQHQFTAVPEVNADRVKKYRKSFIKPPGGLSNFQPQKVCVCVCVCGGGGLI